MKRWFSHSDRLVLWIPVCLGGSTLAMPDASNTGYAGNLAASGSLTITEDGTLLENLHVSGTITVKADDVVIRNCLIDGGGIHSDESIGAFYGIHAGHGGQNLLIENCEIRAARSACVLGSDFTLRNSHLWDSGGDAIKPFSNVLVEGCFIEKLGYIDSSHSDGVQMVSGANVTIRACHFEMDSYDGDGDGTGLLVEYALGLSPNEFNPSPLGLVVNDEALAFSFPRMRAELGYVVEQSADLEVWTTDGVTQGSSEVGSVDMATILPTDPGLPVFVRLRVTR